MTTHTRVRPLTWAVAMLVLATAPAAHGQSAGYMSFQSAPTEVTVTTGTAESYMRAGRDWQRPMPPAPIPTTPVTPTIVQKSRITTWSDSTGIHFRFAIPDVSRTNTVGTDSTLSCGDHVILQFSPLMTTPTLTGPERRFEIVMKDNLPAALNKRIPNAIGNWSAAATSTTVVTPMVTVVTDEYRFTLDIPWGEANLTPSMPFALALAIVNDLGHSTGSPAINEASGTAFPVAMGLTPESDPGLTCGTVTTPAGETASGNWVKPQTWGTGFMALSTTPSVTLDQGPAVWLSRAIRLGRCNITDFNAIKEATTANWVADQQDLMNNWYKFNAQNPCRMTIWINATVAPPGTTERRFLAVWGRPGISPQAWYFAGVSDPVSVGGSGPTTAVSFVWNRPPPVAGGFSDHPCLKVYVLPATFTPGQQTVVDNLIKDTSANGAALAPFEAEFGVSFGNGTVAQMNFANYDNLSSCTEAQCMPIVSVISPEEGFLARWSPFAILRAQPRPEEPRPGQPPVDDRPGDGDNDNRRAAARIVAHGFGIAVPQGNKPYTYIEDLGGLGWVVSDQVLAQAETIQLRLQVSNPAITEKVFVNGMAVEVPSPNRRIFVVPVVDVGPGMEAPRLDLSALNRLLENPLTPGQTVDSQITVSAGGVGPTGFKWWWWIVLLVVLIILIALYLSRRPATP